MSRCDIPSDLASLNRRRVLLPTKQMCIIGPRSISLPTCPGFVMRSVLSATLMVAAIAAFAGASAQAQMTPPSTAGAKPKPVTTIPIRPALQTPADTANAMAQAERLALQSDLAWVGRV